MSFFDDLFDIPHVEDEDHYGVFPPRADSSTPARISTPTRATATPTGPAGAGLIPFIPTTSTHSTIVPTSTSTQLTSTLSSTSSTITTTSVPPTPPVVTTTSKSTTATEQQPGMVTSIRTITRSSTPSSTPSQNSSVVDSKNTGSGSGPSPVAIGITVTVVVLVVILAGLFFFRRHSINKRKNRRQTWNAPVKSTSGHQGADAEAYGTEKTGQGYDRFDDIDINEKKSAQPLPDNFTLQNTAGYASNHPYAAYPQNHYSPGQIVPPPPPVSLPAPPPPLHPTGLAPIRAPSPPPMSVAISTGPAPLGLDTTTPGAASSYNNQVMPIAQFSAVSSPHPSLVTPSFNTPYSGATAGGALLTVARTFVPSLPDELPVQIGEQIRVVEKYDDGWALCERMKAGAGVESGVVPIECLQFAPAAPAEAGPAPTTVPGMGMMQERVDTWRLSHRNSSLHPIGKY